MNAGPAPTSRPTPGNGAAAPVRTGPRTPAELHAALQRLRALFVGQEPAEFRTGVIAVDGGREMLLGTTALAVQHRYVARPSGLLIPTGAVPMPLDSAGIYLTGQEVFGVAPSAAITQDQLQRLPFRDVLGFIAGTLAAHRRPGVPMEQTDRELAERWFVGPTRVRVRNLLRNPMRRLVVPQALYVLAKLAAVCSPDVLLPGVEPGRPVVTLFGALAAVDAEHDDVGDEDLIVDTEVSPLTSRLLANQHLNKPLDEDHVTARFVRQWLHLPKERADDRRVLDLEQAFAEATGVRLRDVLIVATALWARALTGQPMVPPDYFAALDWSADRLAAALGLFSVDAVTLRGLLRQEADEASPAWSFSALEQFPVVRFDDGALLVLDRSLLVRRIFGGLTLYDITAPLESGNRTSRKRAGRVKNCVEHLAEVYALEVFQAVAVGIPASPRVFGDAELQRAFARKGRRLADAAVDYGDAWVVAEITTSKLTRRSVAASADAISADLDKLVGEAEQVDHTIAALRADESRLTGAPAAPARRYYPLLVVAEGFPVNPVSTELLRKRVLRAGLLTGDDVAPLEVVDTVELSMMQSLAEQSGLSIRDVLAGKERAVFFRDSVRNYLLQECGHNPRRPERIEQLMHEALEPAMHALKPPEAA